VHCPAHAPDHVQSTHKPHAHAQVTLEPFLELSLPIPPASEASQLRSQAAAVAATPSSPSAAAPFRAPPSHDTSASRHHAGLEQQAPPTAAGSERVARLPAGPPPRPHTTTATEPAPQYLHTGSDHGDALRSRWLTSAASDSKALHPGEHPEPRKGKVKKATGVSSGAMSATQQSALTGAGVDDTVQSAAACMPPAASMPKETAKVCKFNPS
jgi:hypothetical protein